MLNNVLKNRYQIIAKIGGGGMAIVYKAKDTLLNRNVAIKVLKSSLTENDAFIKRFNNEAQSIASLSHVNVIPVYDIGEEKGTYYIVMEFVKGLTLDEYIRQKTKLNINESLNLSLQVCSAIKHAHLNGVIHRDIKPENVLLTENNIAKVVDFGISKTSTSTSMTQSGIVMGSVQYISPEQAKGEQSDERSDIYSFGISLYEMLTGVLPFNADNAYAIALKHIQDDPIPPKEINPNIPDQLNNIIMKLIKKNPLERYQDIKDLIEDLKSFKNFYKLSENKFKTTSKPYSKSPKPSSIKINFVIFLLSLGIIFVSILFIKAYKNNTNESQYTESETVLYKMKDFVGMDINKAKEVLINQDKWKENYIIIKKEYSDDIPKNQILLQNINTNEDIKLNVDYIEFTISNGPKVTE